MTEHWDQDTPIYLQLHQMVIGRILDRHIKEGEALPSVRSVAAEYRLNPLTVSKAYQMLQDDNIVEKQRGKGLFVLSGAREHVLQREREIFLRDQWPMIVKQIERLGISMEELVEKNKGMQQ